jgi:hypothetical protein
VKGCVCLFRKLKHGQGKQPLTGKLSKEDGIAKYRTGKMRRTFNQERAPLLHQGRKITSKYYGSDSQRTKNYWTFIFE